MFGFGENMDCAMFLDDEDGHDLRRVEKFKYIAKELKTWKSLENLKDAIF
ncbi:MAG TPA: hypothetical protein VJH92_02470 [Candidatus Nanoarchaeia archaeon]|nr:hypothetical protein [Candidatus Nanoarchaeia archaeon]